MDKATNLLKFLQNENVVRINNEAEYVNFRRTMIKHGLDTLVLPREATYEDVLKLYNLPNNVHKHPGWDGMTLYAECQNGKEAIAIYPYTAHTTVVWYGVEPMAVRDII